MLALSTKPKISLKKIVVATDLTPASRAALDRAIAIATHYGSKLILVHAVVRADWRGHHQHDGEREDQDRPCQAAHVFESLHDR